MEGLTQDGLVYCGLPRGSASNTNWDELGEGQVIEFPGKQLLGYAQTISSDARKLSLAQTIEAEIIPRLMLLHGARPGLERALEEKRASHDMEEAVDFCDLMLRESVRAGLMFVDGLLDQGYALEVLYLDLFAPAARRLGAMWEADLCNFADVTIGLGRLQQVMHSYSDAFRGDLDGYRSDRRALLIAAPGEQHTLGVFMVSEFFRKAGWEVWGEPPTNRKAISEIAAAEWFDVIGISVGSASRLPEVTTAIDEICKVSLNRDVRVLVGGPMFVAAPELVLQVGAHAMAIDAREAVLTAEALIAERVSSR